MGVHCYLTELGALVTMAAKIAAVITLASLCAAEPGYGYGYGINAVAYHPYGGYSSEYRSTQGLTGYGGYYGKREAEPGYGYGHGYGAASVYASQADHGYGYNPAQYTYGYNIGHGYGKRSADAEPGYGYGHAVSYSHRSPQGVHGHYGGYGYGGYYGKRSAEPGYYGGASSFVHQSRPYYHGSYGYGINHYGKKST